MSEGFRWLQIRGSWQFACERCGYRPADPELHRCSRWPRLRKWARWTRDGLFEGFLSYGWGG